MTVSAESIPTMYWARKRTSDAGANGEHPGAVHKVPRGVFIGAPFASLGGKVLTSALSAHSAVNQPPLECSSNACRVPSALHDAPSKCAPLAVGARAPI